MAANSVNDPDEYFVDWFESEPLIVSADLAGITKPFLRKLVKYLGSIRGHKPATAWGKYDKLKVTELRAYILRIQFVRVGDIRRSASYVSQVMDDIPFGFHVITRDRLTALDNARFHRICTNNGVQKWVHDSESGESWVRPKSQKIQELLEVQTEDGGLEIPIFAEDAPFEPWLLRILASYPYDAICEVAGAEPWLHTRTEMQAMILQRLGLTETAMYAKEEFDYDWHPFLTVFDTRAKISMLPARVLRVGMRTAFQLARTHNKAEAVDLVVAQMHLGHSTDEEVRVMIDRSEQRMAEVGEDWYVMRHRQHLLPEDVDDDCCVECTRPLDNIIDRVCVDCSTWHLYLSHSTRIDDDTSFLDFVTHECTNPAYICCNKYLPVAFFDLTDGLHPRRMCRNCCDAQPDEIDSTRWVRIAGWDMVRLDRRHPLSGLMPARDQYLSALTQLFFDSKQDGRSVCAYCGLRLLVARGEAIHAASRRPQQISLDRAIAGRPYFQFENLRICCWQCNRAKHTWLLDVFLDTLQQMLAQTRLTVPAPPVIWSESAAVEAAQAILNCRTADSLRLAKYTQRNKLELIPSEQRDMGTLTIADLRAIYERQGGRCAMTGMAFELTHQGKVPLQMSVDRLGGVHTLHTRENVQLVCLMLNFAKGQMDDNAGTLEWLHRFEAED